MRRGLLYLLSIVTMSMALHCRTTTLIDGHITFVTDVKCEPDTKFCTRALYKQDEVAMCAPKSFNCPNKFYNDTCAELTVLDPKRIKRCCCTTDFCNGGGVAMIIGAVFTMFWWTMLIEMTSLSINRFLTVVFFSIAQVVYGKKSLKIIGLITLIIGAIICILKLIPGNNYLFVTSKFSWGPPATDDDYSVIMQLISKYLMIVMEGITVAAYIVILLYIWSRNGKNFSKRERSITIQLLVSSTYTIAIWVYWTYLEYPVFGGNITANYVSVHMWILLNGVNVIVFMIFNRRLRISVIRIIVKCKLPSGKEKIETSRSRGPIITSIKVSASG